MRPTSRIIVNCSLVAVAAGLGVAALCVLREPNPLRGVVEPITIVQAISWSDGGSKGLAFKDARGVVRYACLMDDLQGNRNLVLGSYLPIHDVTLLRRHPIGGAAERSFTRLMEEWASGDPDAHWWDKQLGRYERGEIPSEKVSEGSPSGSFDLKAQAVSVLRDLRQRNPA